MSFCDVVPSEKRRAYCKVLGALLEFAVEEFLELAPREDFPAMAENLRAVERVLKVGERCGCRRG